MELNKNKYSKKEVADILTAYKGEYEKRISENREIISRLNDEIKSLNAYVDSLKEKENILVATLTRAEKTAMEVEENAKLQYSLEVERLKKFSKKWNAYFEELKDKYPLYPPVKKARAIKNEVDCVTEEDNPKEFINRLDSQIPETNGKTFDPKKKIKDYIAATGVNGFNIDEVLNPGELQLEDLCKELGLIDSDE
ncbi:MAG: hypothetical protein E7373_03285 [Clostridiales bacterium]|nr:hypothetical protein [Clostridiales bacterium]